MITYNGISLFSGILKKGLMCALIDHKLRMHILELKVSLDYDNI